MGIFDETWIFLSAAIVLGLLFPQAASAVQPYIMFLLIVMMTLSTKDIVLKNLYKEKKKTLILFFLNYFVLGALIIALSFFLTDKEYVKGMVVMAAVPCAIAVIPFTKLLGGNTTVSTSALIGIYISSLVLTPLIIWLFYSESIDVLELVKTVVLFVLVPLVASRFIGRLKFNDKPLINILFFVMSYTLVGINQEAITKGIILDVTLVIFVRTIVSSAITYYTLKGHDKIFAVNASVFMGFKNLGYAAVLTLALFGSVAAVPATIGLIFENLNFIVLEKLIVKK